ncbi:MAG: alpha/beta fold hydrolase [Chloroflexota bacterium]|nr:alpha/beta fold hydrolase [Chloroflexota bacterium]
MAGSEEVRFLAGDAMLAGTLQVPDGADRFPSVLLLPSYLARDRDGSWDRGGHPAWFLPGGQAGLLSRLAAALAERGVASLRYDKRGCGRSEGAWEKSDLFTLIDDARDALGWLRGRRDLDLRRTGVIGHGEGAAIGISVAIGDPVISALTLVAGAARSWRDVLRRGVAERMRTESDYGHALVSAIDRAAEELIEAADRRESSRVLHVNGAGAIELNLAAWEQAIHTPPLALASMLHRSVTLVHAEADAWVDADEGRLLHSTLAAAGNRSELRLVPGAGHDLDEAGGQLIGEVADDLATRLLPRELPPVLLAIEEMG